MGSGYRPHSYDETTLSALEQALRDSWTLLKARDPLRDWAMDTDLRSRLAERLMALADEGINRPDELSKRAIESLPSARRSLFP
jgi:hypothetical protein